MAKMYARRRGKSRSKRPTLEATWVSYSPEEVERLILKLSKDGHQSAKIGLILRDQYGIPLVKHVCKKPITQILKENDALRELPEDLFNLLRKSVNLRNHMKKNKRDAHSKRGLELVESKIRRLVKYYLKTKKLSTGWKYDPEQAKLIVEKAK